MNMAEKWLLEVFFRSWRVLLLRGIVGIIFGILAITWPQITLMFLAYLFGIYVLVDGALGVWTAIATYKKNESWWTVLLWGLVSIVAGVITLIAPGITLIVLLFYIAIWAIATGVLEIIAAIRLRAEITGEWLLILSGIISVIFGIMLIAWPGAGLVALTWMVGIYAIFFGLLITILAFRIHSIGCDLTKSPEE